MTKQVLSSAQRKKIRARLYKSDFNQKPEPKDGKLQLFKKYTDGKVVLDLGCIDHDEENWRSKFWLHKAIKEVAKEVVGLDYYKEGVEKLRENGFDIVYGDAQKFDFDKKFDVVTAGDLIEHLPNLNGFMSSVRSALKKNGLFVISTPNPWCWKYYSYHALRGKLAPMNPEHVSWFCLQTLENLGSRYGFCINYYEYFSRRTYEKLVPLPAHLKHTTIGLVYEKKD